MGAVARRQASVLARRAWRNAPVPGRCKSPLSTRPAARWSLSNPMRLNGQAASTFLAWSSFAEHRENVASPGILVSQRPFCTSSPSQGKSKEVPASEEDEKKLGFMAKMKLAFRKYGWVFLGYYGAVWVVSNGVCFAVLETAGVDGVEILLWFGADQLYAGITDWNKHIVNAVLAIEITECFELIRLPFVMATTPRVAEWWRSRGSKEGAQSGGDS